MTLLLLSIIVVVLDVLCVCPEPVLANHRVSPENSQINRGAVSFRFVVCRYPTRRYGSENEHATAAWEILRTTVYNYGGCGAQHDKTISCVSPSPAIKLSNDPPGRSLLQAASAATTTAQAWSGRCLKTAFLRHLYIKTSILPRQARDKHRESTQKSGVF